MENYISRVAFDPTEARTMEKVIGKSMTIEGESYTINELFARHMKGVLTGVERPSYYEETEDFDAIDFEKLRFADPFEKEQLFKEVELKAKNAREAISKWQKEQKTKESEQDDNDTSEPPKPKKTKKVSEAKQSETTESKEAEKGD